MIFNVFFGSADSVVGAVAAKAASSGKAATRDSRRRRSMGPFLLARADHLILCLTPEQTPPPPCRCRRPQCLLRGALTGAPYFRFWPVSDREPRGTRRRSLFQPCAAGYEWRLSSTGTG